MPQPIEFTPKEPQTEGGRQARQQYLQFARRIIDEPTMDYSTLYKRFAPNDWAAIQLNDAVAEVALREGMAPQGVTGLLCQGPFAQCQHHQRGITIQVLHRCLRASLIVAKQQIDAAKHDDPVEFLLGRTLG
jgi:hypothetical protein